MNIQTRHLEDESRAILHAALAASKKRAEEERQILFHKADCDIDPSEPPEEEEEDPQYVVLLEKIWRNP